MYLRHYPLLFIPQRQIIPARPFGRVIPFSGVVLQFQPLKPQVQVSKLTLAEVETYPLPVIAANSGLPFRCQQKALASIPLLRFPEQARS